MVPKEYATKSDLDSLEIRITKDSKEDIVKAKDERHRMAWEIQRSFVMIDDIKTDNLLLKQSHSNMADKLEKIENTCNKIIEKIDLFKDTFVTKEAHKEAHEENKSKISRLENWVLALLVSLALYLIAMAWSKIFH